MCTICMPQLRVLEGMCAYELVWLAHTWELGDQGLGALMGQIAGNVSPPCSQVVKG